MKHLGIASFLAGAAITVLGCSSSVSPGDSETHWIECKTTADCHDGKTCEDEHCVVPSTLDGGPGSGGAPSNTGSGGAPGSGGAVPVAPTSIENPTGTCVAPDSGARRGYHSPEAGDVWLPDCKNPLEREYYRVFAKSPTSAYVIPRPDGAFELVQPCNDATHPMRALVEKYSLCDVASDSATVNRINHMTPADALTLTHYMHGVLLFEQQEGVPNANLRPFAIPSDVLDACALHASELSAGLAEDCRLERAAVDSGLENPAFYDTAGELAKLLNEVYGVAGCVRPDYAGRQCTQCGGGGCLKIGISCLKPCTTSADCNAGSDCIGVACQPRGTFCPF